MIDQLIFNFLKFMNIDYFKRHQYFYFLPYVNKNITSELLITNIVQNTTSNYIKISPFKIVILRYCSNDNLWNFVKFINFSSNYLKISTNDLKAQAGDMFLIFPVQDSFMLPKNNSLFPNIFLKQNDFSPHTIRGKLSFIEQDSKTSYMSEYPFHMSQIDSGSSFCMPEMLIGKKSNDIYLIFVSILESIPTKQEFFLDMIELHENKLLSQVKIYPNKSNIIKLNKFSKKNFYIKANAVGIPIFLNREFGSSGNVSLNVEHTHPPSELFYDNPFANQANIKRNWFNRKKCLET